MCGQLHNRGTCVQRFDLAPLAKLYALADIAIEVLHQVVQALGRLPVMELFDNCQIQNMLNSFWCVMAAELLVQRCPWLASLRDTKRIPHRPCVLPPSWKATAVVARYRRAVRLKTRTANIYEDIFAPHISTWLFAIKYVWGNTGSGLKNNLKYGWAMGNKLRNTAPPQFHNFRPGRRRNFDKVSDESVAS